MFVVLYALVILCDHISRALHMDMELVSWDIMSSLLCREPEEVVQVYGFCVRTLHLMVISVVIIRVMWLLHNEKAVPDDRFWHHLFKAVFVTSTLFETTSP